MTKKFLSSLAALFSRPSINLAAPPADRYIVVEIAPGCWQIHREGVPQFGGHVYHDASIARVICAARNHGLEMAEAAIQQRRSA